MPDHPPKKPQPPPEPLRVLVVDDNAVNSFVTSKMLERLDHRVRVVSSGAQATEVLRTERRDLVLVELGTSGGEGLETTRQIREAESGAAAPARIVGLAAGEEPPDEQRCRDAGLDGVLPRPFTLEALAAILETTATEDTPALAAGGESPASPTGPALDRARLGAQLGGDTDAVEEVLSQFLQEGPATLARLRAAVASGDGRGAVHAAHRLKGTLRWITADAAATRAEAVEIRARAHGPDVPPRLLDELASEVSRALDAAREKS